ncbi:MAG: DUF4407 domain-containing protein [Bacteroidetes bacterium]|nr:DUF4407 domain-containing protein [Bacteroidota bacterium]
MKQFNFHSALLWLSKTDPKLYTLCPQNVKWNRTALGYFVLLTGIFAFFTGSYFVRSIFAEYNEVTKTIETSAIGWIVSTLAGALWGWLVILIDREIVSATSRWSAFVRIPLAIIIGLVIATPFKIQLFSGRINKELMKSSRVENSVYEKKKESTIKGSESKISDLESKIQNERNQMADWQSVMEAETVGRVKSGRTGKAGQGPAYEEAKQNYELHKGFAEDYEKQLSSASSKFDATVTSAKNEFNGQKIDQAYDFLSQYEQMEALKETNKKLSFFAFLISALFILIEVVPALMKLLKSSDEYDALLEVRTVVSRQLAYAAANMAMDELATNPANLLSNGNYPYSPNETIELIKKNI